jgi:hypothetical protein
MQAPNSTSKPKKKYLAKVDQGFMITANVLRKIGETMIFEFKSRATGSVIMTKDVAQNILRIIGKDASPQGIIVPQAMPEAIAALQKAITDEKAADKNSAPTSDDEGSGRSISLAQRAIPFIEMLQRAHSAGKDITWGV